MTDTDEWDVFANAVEILELPGFLGDEIELTVEDDEYTFEVDGLVRSSDPPDALLEWEGDYVLQASRLDDTLFEATVRALE